MPKPEMTLYDDDKGQHVLPANQRAFLEWYAMPEWTRVENGLPRWSKEWAELNGVSTHTLRDWKRKPIFRRELEKLLAEINVSPARLQKIVQTLYRKATSTDDRDQVKAAQLYMQYVDKLQPTRVVIDRVERDAESLSDEELAAELEASVVQLRAVPSSDFEDEVSL